MLGYSYARWVRTRSRLLSYGPAVSHGQDGAFQDHLLQFSGQVLHLCFCLICLCKLTFGLGIGVRGVKRGVGVWRTCILILSQFLFLLCVIPFQPFVLGKLIGGRMREDTERSSRRTY